MQDTGALSESPGEGRGPSPGPELICSLLQDSTETPPRLLAGQTTAALGENTVSTDFGAELRCCFLSLAIYWLSLIYENVRGHT